MLLEILIKHVRVIPVYPIEKVTFRTETMKVLFIAELANLGYRISNDSFAKMPDIESVLQILKKMRGGDVDYVPLFKGFPNNVPEQNEIFFKRIVGFFGNLTGYFNEENSVVLENGVCVPKWLLDLDAFNADPIFGRQTKSLFDVGKLDQDKRKEDTHTEWIDLKFGSGHEELEKFITNILYAKSSIRETLKPVIEYLITDTLVYFDTSKIIFKETRSYLMKFFWTKAWYRKLIYYVDTPTDLLRMFACLTNTDISLATPIKFPKFTRIQRRFIVSLLSSCQNLEECLQQYRGLWLKIGKSIHIGEYHLKYPKVYKAFDLLRNGKIETFNSKIEKSLKALDDATLIFLLVTQPGVFARRLHHVLRIAKSYQKYLDTFASIADRVQLKNLLVLYYYFKTIETSEYRTIINKKGKILVKCNTAEKLNADCLQTLLRIIHQAMFQKIRNEKESWEGKKVWVDESLHKYTIPLQQRKASEGLLNLGRGSRIPLQDGLVLRLFVYWKQKENRTDLDLSLISFDQDMNYQGQVSYTNLASQGIVHSGDITSAPLGASEFIDIDLSKTDTRCRYIASQIYKFSGDNFVDLDTCYSGWMLRENTDKNYKSFDIKTVQNKFDLKGSGAYAIPILIDLQKKEIIFVDLYMKGREQFNRTEGALMDVSLVSKELARMIETKPNIGDLAFLHAIARRASIVDDKEDSDISFGVKDCTYNVNDVSLILSDLL